MVSIKEYVRINRVILLDEHNVGAIHELPLQDLDNLSFLTILRKPSLRRRLVIKMNGVFYWTYTITFRTPYDNAASIEFM